MPRDSNSNYSLPSGYLAVPGQTIQAAQHNGPLEDLGHAITGSVARNGTGGMLANLNMNDKRVTNLGDGTAPGDAVALGQVPELVASAAQGAVVKPMPVDADTIPINDSAAAFGLKKLTWASAKAALKTYFDTVYAAVAHSHTFASLTAKPNTLAGYGITDAPISKEYVSGQQVIDNGALVTLTHGLGAIPKIVQYVLVCTADDAGYSVGDTLLVWGAGGSGGTGDNRGNYPVITATSIAVRYANSGTGAWTIQAKSSGVQAPITNASWRLVVKAYA